MSKPKECPHCKGFVFREVDCGPDTYEDDISYLSYECAACKLWFDGWQGKWLLGIDSEEEYKSP